eukprot:gene7979-16287_t
MSPRTLTLAACAERTPAGRNATMWACCGHVLKRVDGEQGPQQTCAETDCVAGEPVRTMDEFEQRTDGRLTVGDRTLRCCNVLPLLTVQLHFGAERAPPPADDLADDSSAGGGDDASARAPGVAALVAAVRELRACGDDAAADAAGAELRRLVGALTIADALARAGLRSSRDLARKRRTGGGGAAQDHGARLEADPVDGLVGLDEVGLVDEIDVVEFGEVSAPRRPPSLSRRGAGCWGRRIPAPPPRGLGGPSALLPR